MAARADIYRADWRQGRVTSWLTTVDHKRIGILYIVTAFVFFVAGGMLALLMRAQLATPNEHFITQDSYNELFTIHGTTMIFLFIVPFWAGLGELPRAADDRRTRHGLPRLNALSYWLFVLGGIVLFLSFFANGGAARSGWYELPTALGELLHAGHRPGSLDPRRCISSRSRR